MLSRPPCILEILKPELGRSFPRSGRPLPFFPRARYINCRGALIRLIQLIAAQASSWIYKAAHGASGLPRQSETLGYLRVEALLAGLFGVTKRRDIEGWFRGRIIKLRSRG